MTDRPEDFRVVPEPEASCPDCHHFTLYYVMVFAGVMYPTHGNPEPPEFESHCLCTQGRGTDGCKCEYVY